MAPTNILVVGCGVAGPVLASYLLLSPLPVEEKPRITILERSSSLRAAGQNVDIRGAGVTVIRKLGIEKIIRASTTGEEGTMFVDSENRNWASFPADKSGQIQTGTSDIEILRGRLAEICYRRSNTISDEIQKNGGNGIEYIFGDYLADLNQEGDKVNVRFAKSGKTRTFDLVVGADGLQSLTRNLAWGADGEEDRVHRLGMYGGFFSMPKAETDNPWMRWFNAPGRRGIIVRPGEQKETSTVFIYMINEADGRLKSVAVDGRKGVEAQKALLKEYFHDAGWESKRILREMKTADDFYYDMVAQVKMSKWSKGRVVLLGDAGFCASPISGMGTTLALTGAYYLAGAILHHPHDCSAAFDHYENKVRPIVDKAQKLAPGAPHIINPETAWGIWVFHLILAFISRSGLANLVFMLTGPPANAVPVEEYGFHQPTDLVQ